MVHNSSVTVQVWLAPNANTYSRAIDQEVRRMLRDMFRDKSVAIFVQFPFVLRQTSGPQPQAKALITLGAALTAHREEIKAGVINAVQTKIAAAEVTLAPAPPVSDNTTPS